MTDWTYGTICLVIYTIIVVLPTVVVWLVIYCLLKHCKKEFREPKHIKLRPNHENDSTILVDPLQNEQFGMLSIDGVHKSMESHEFVTDFSPKSRRKSSSFTKV
jgi:hypothetical protein